MTSRNAGGVKQFLSRMTDEGKLRHRRGGKVQEMKLQRQQHSRVTAGAGKKPVNYGSKSQRNVLSDENKSVRGHVRSSNPVIVSLR